MNRWVVALGFAFTAALLASAIGRVGLAQTLELKTYDARMRAVATGQGTPPPIAMVLIDDHSIRQLEPLVGRWPWPRMVHAVLVNFLARAPAKLIVYDVLFAEGDKATTEIGGTAWTGAESDQALVDAVEAAGTVILVAEASSEATERPNADQRPSLDGIPSLSVRWPVHGFAERRPLLVPPFPALAQAARGLGHARVAYDLDGPWRRYIPFVEVEDRIVPALPVAAALAVAGTLPEQVSASRGSLHLGPTRVPWIEQIAPDYYGPAKAVWRPLVPFRGPTMRADHTPTFPSYSFQDVFLAEQQLLAGEPPHLDPAVFKDRIVVVGVTAQGLTDLVHHAVWRRPHARRRGPRQRHRRTTQRAGHRTSRSLAAGGRHACPGPRHSGRGRPGGAVGHGRRVRGCGLRRRLVRHPRLGTRRVAAAGRAGHRVPAHVPGRPGVAVFR